MKLFVYDAMCSGGFMSGLLEGCERIAAKTKPICRIRSIGNVPFMTNDWHYKVIGELCEVSYDIMYGIDSVVIRSGMYIIDKAQIIDGSDRSVYYYAPNTRARRLLDRFSGRSSDRFDTSREYDLGDIRRAIKKPGNQQ